MAITINFEEKDIEDFLCDNDNLESYLGLKFIKRQVKIDKFYIDILAYSKPEKCFYIIELKKDDLNSKAFVQALKYLRLMNRRYKYKHKFKMLLVGHDLSEELYYNVEKYDIFGNSDYPFLYTLYHYTFNSGISFEYYDKYQFEIENKILNGEMENG